MKNSTLACASCPFRILPGDRMITVIHLHASRVCMRRCWLGRAPELQSVQVKDHNALSSAFLYFIIDGITAIVSENVLLEGCTLLQKDITHGIYWS